MVFFMRNGGGSSSQQSSGELRIENARSLDRDR